jgi:hypothetical protein
MPRRNILPPSSGLKTKQSSQPSGLLFDPVFSYEQGIPLSSYPFFRWHVSGYLAFFRSEGIVVRLNMLVELLPGNGLVNSVTIYNTQQDANNKNSPGECFSVRRAQCECYRRC